MIRQQKSNLMHLVTIMALVVQLGGAAYHHHDLVGVHDHAHAVMGDAGHQHAVGHPEDNHNHDEDHHNPLDGGHQDCDLCLLKTAFSSTLIPQANGGFGVLVTSTKLRFIGQDTQRHAAILRRYRARAPPFAITHS